MEILIYREAGSIGPQHKSGTLSIAKGKGGITLKREGIRRQFKIAAQEDPELTNYI